MGGLLVKSVGEGRLRRTKIKDKRIKIKTTKTKTEIDSQEADGLVLKRLTTRRSLLKMDIKQIILEVVMLIV